MKFEINGLEWIIKEVSQQDFLEYNQKNGIDESGRTYSGRTLILEQEIWISKDLSKGQKRKTLYHELMHCYIINYITFMSMDNIDEELWCDISSNSHDLIHEIVENYFSKKTRK